MPKAEKPADVQELELLKAVAQAWHAQTGNPKPTKEFDAQKNRFNFKHRPTRFKIEAMNLAASRESSSSSSSWDFSESLLDSYEIVTLSKKLEANLALEHPMSGHPGGAWAGKRSRAESKNSLRKLFNKTSSKRFDAASVPRKDGD